MGAAVAPACGIEPGPTLGTVGSSVHAPRSACSSLDPPPDAQHLVAATLELVVDPLDGGHETRSPQVVDDHLEVTGRGVPELHQREHAYLGRDPSHLAYRVGVERAAELLRVEEQEVPTGQVPATSTPAAETGGAASTSMIEHEKLRVEAGWAIGVAKGAAAERRASDELSSQAGWTQDLLDSL